MELGILREAYADVSKRLESEYCGNRNVFSDPAVKASMDAILWAQRAGDLGAALDAVLRYEQAFLHANRNQHAPTGNSRMEPTHLPQQVAPRRSPAV